MPFKLNLGCGTDFRPGFLNMDSRNLAAPDGAEFLRADVGRVLEYVDQGSAAEIVAWDVLEHFPQAMARNVLDQWIAALQIGGTLSLSLPDLDALAHFILNKSNGWTDEQRAHQVYGGQEYPQNFHMAGFTRSFITSLLEERGMQVTSIVVHPRCETSMIVSAVKRG